VLASAVAATLALAAPEIHAQARGGASKAEVQAIEAQMKALAERLDRLESANATLQTRTRSSSPPSSVATRRSTTSRRRPRTSRGRRRGLQRGEQGEGRRLGLEDQVQGDLRYRPEMIAQDREVSGSADDAADRTRHRIRARSASRPR